MAEATISVPASQVVILHEDRVKRSYADIKILKQKLKEKRAMLKDAFENDAEYDSILTEINEKKRALAAVRQKIAGASAIIQLKIEIRDMNAELKDHQIGLFEDLEAYSRTMNTNYIEIDDEQKRIVKNYKLVSKRP